MTMRFIPASLFLLAALPSLTRAACDAPSKSTVEDWGESCDQLKAASDCNVDPGACEKAKKEDANAVTIVKQQYQNVCSAVQAYQNAKNACTNGQSTCTGAAATTLTQAKNALKTAENAFTAELTKLKSQQQALAEEVKSVAQSTESSKSCVQSGHGQDSSQQSALASKLSDMGNQPTNKNLDTQGSRLTQNYGKALIATQSSIEKVNSELTKMKNRETDLAPMAAQNDANTKKLGSGDDNSSISGLPSAPSGGSGGGSGSGNGSGTSGNGGSGSDLNLGNNTPNSPNSPGGNSPNPGANSPGGGSQAGGVTNNLTPPGSTPSSPEGPNVGGNSTGNSSYPGQSYSANSGPSSPYSNPAPTSGTGSSSGGSVGSLAAAGSTDEKPSSTGTATNTKTGSEAASTGGGGGGGGDESVASFSKPPLGDPKFTLAGSETDESVKNLVGALNSDANRGPASTEKAGSADHDNADLFVQVHSYYQRCQLKGCVTGAIRQIRGGA